MGEAKQKCCKMKRGSGRFGFFNRTQCTRDSTCTRDGKPYCTQHDPVRVAKRAEDRYYAKQKQWAEQQERRDAAQCREKGPDNAVAGRLRRGPDRCGKGGGEVKKPCTHRPGSVRRQARDMGLLRTVYSHAARCAATVRTVSLTRHEPRGSSLRHHRGLAFDDRPRRVQPAEFLQSPDSSPVDQAEFRS